MPAFPAQASFNSFKKNNLDEWQLDGLLAQQLHFFSELRSLQLPSRGSAALRRRDDPVTKSITTGGPTSFGAVDAHR
eukprot:8846349-Pyramimonas_sp.AAC.1